MLPPPATLGLPEQFSSWRPHQPDAIWRAVESTERFVSLVLPTGAGKSLTAQAIPAITGWRTAFLTSTKNLQLQYNNDFSSIGLVDIRGQSNYRCVAFDDEHAAYRADDGRFQSCEEGPCHAGLGCSRKPTQQDPQARGCHYYDALGRARKARLVVTNYKLWLTQNTFGQGLGRFDCLVLDEAHNAPQELADFLSTPILHREVMQAQIEPPAEQQDITAWARWGKLHAGRLERRLEDLRPRTRHEMQRFRTLKGLQRKCETLSSATPEDWVLTLGQDGWNFDPIWVSRHGEVLFQRIPKVVLTSATFARKTAEMLGVEGDSLAWHEAPSDFPVSRRPVLYVPTVKMDYRANDATIREWIGRIDQIIRARGDRKGLIDSVSYARRNTILQHSEYASRMITHDSKSAREAIERFKAAGPGAILLSPSMRTGYDFPGTDCEYIIVTKIPFPDRRDPVTLARTKADPEYPNYVAMQELVQVCGRGMRSADDRCETLIVDDNASWFVPKNRHLAPRWFMDSFRRCSGLPTPPPSLTSDGMQFAEE